MPIWIFSLVAALVAALPASAAIITQLPGPEKQVALTFDACESQTPATFDRSIGDYLLAEKLPVTLFVTGRFARHNQDALRELAAQDFVELENHSLDHIQHMERLDDSEMRRQIEANGALLLSLFGRHSRFFRFPAGNSDPHAVALAEGLGYRVVHWSFASGDPARDLSPQQLQDWVLARTRPGSILIFHINGRGWSTGRALPGIVLGLRRQGYRFVTLAEALR